MKKEQIIDEINELRENLRCLPRDRDRFMEMFDNIEYYVNNNT